MGFRAGSFGRPAGLEVLGSLREGRPAKEAVLVIPLGLHRFLAPRAPHDRGPRLEAPPDEDGAFEPLLVLARKPPVLLVHARLQDTLRFIDAFLVIASKRDQRRYADEDIPGEIARKILEAGRIAGSAVNKQPWRFVVIDDPGLREQLAEMVYAADNVRGAKLVVAIVITGNPGFDAGRAAQNMMLAAWNEGVTSCPNGMPDADAASKLLGLGDGERVINILTFGFPEPPRTPEDRSAQEWLARAKRKNFDEVVERK